MRRTSLTPDQARDLAEALKARRHQLGMSRRQVAAQSGLNSATMVVLEAGTNLSPQPSTLRPIADTLNLNLTDLFALVGWLPPDQLPTLKPYLRAKYHNLDERAITDLEAYADLLARRHGGLGPIDHEDEQP